jgi:hypothetical protein
MRLKYFDFLTEKLHCAYSPYALKWAKSCPNTVNISTTWTNLRSFLSILDRIQWAKKPFHAHVKKYLRNYPCYRQSGVCWPFRKFRILQKESRSYTLDPLWIQIRIQVYVVKCQVQNFSWMSPFLKNWPVKGFGGRSSSVGGPLPPKFLFGVARQFL